jgi:aminoglycoside phosphotransferase (APT) family kinase protein
MSKEKRAAILKPGDLFRDWLVEVLGDRIENKNCRVKVYRIFPASHTVCRFELEDQGVSVMAKFYAEPTGWKREYDAARSMNREFNTLQELEKTIDVPRPLARSERFSCVLVTEYIKGRSLFKLMKAEDGLYDHLTSVARIQRRLHDSTASHYRKDREFARFHKVLDQLKFDQSSRAKYNQLLGEWWRSPLLDRPSGCRIHSDATPANYLFNGNRAFALDFESSWKHANPVHDLGILAAELKHYFAIHKRDGGRAEPYIGHLLWQYSHGLDEFRRITQALPFFMSLGLLRIMRLGLSPKHRDYIFRESLACLSAYDRV